MLFITVNISFLLSQFSYLSPNRIWNVLIILHWHPLLCDSDFKHGCPPLFNLLSALFSPMFLLIPRQDLLSHLCCFSNLELLTAFNLLNHFLTSRDAWKLALHLNLEISISITFLHSSKLTCWNEFCKIVIFAAFQIQLFFHHLCHFPFVLLGNCLHLLR